MKVYFIIGNNVDLNEVDLSDGLVVGIDRGAYLAYLANIKLDYAVGDFDSISANELELLNDYTQVIKLNPVKDETDTLYALRMFKEHEKVILGGITGPRIEHFVANLKLFYEFDDLKIVDDNSIIMECKNGLEFLKDEYKFYSIFALEDVFNLSLVGFKYPLMNHYLSKSSLIGVSNELVNDCGIISFSKGKLLLIKSKE